MTVKGWLENEQEIDFKLTFSSNKAKILENNGIFGYFCCESFSTENMKPYQGIACLEGRFAEKVFESSLKFSKDLKLERVQLIASSDDSISRRSRFSGTLGLSPVSFCNGAQFGQDAIIHEIRRGYNGFMIDIPKLVFTSVFNSKLQSSFNGATFEIEQFKLGSVLFNERFKVKIDLDCNEMRIPKKIYNAYKQAGVDYQVVFETDPRNNLKKMVRWIAREVYLEFANGRKLFLPLGEKSVIFVDLAMKPHDEEYISLGLFFFDHFAVSFDLKHGRIYFDPKKKDGR